MRTWVAFCLLLVVVAGCVPKMQVFLDPSMPAVDMGQFPKPRQPKPVKLIIEYKVNGVRDPKMERQTRPSIENSINRSGFFTMSDRGNEAIQILIADNFNKQEAIEKGKLVGESYGAYGTVVTSDFTINVQLERPQRLPFARTYKTKFNLAMGNREIPPELHPMSPEKGLQEFCDRLTFGFIRDLVAAGEQ